MSTQALPHPSSPKHRPFRRAVLRGLGVVLPPLLTIVILLWIFGTVQVYVLTPIQRAVQHTIAWSITETITGVPENARILPLNDSNRRQLLYEDEVYIGVARNRWIPLHVFETVREDPGPSFPQTSTEFYLRYTELKYLKEWIVVPLFLCLFILLLYFLGRSLAYGIGMMAYRTMERIITQLPIIRTVYSSVKQVTDFVFSESELEFTRVVAVEYPSKDIWSIGFVTGESMATIRAAAGEPVISVLVPTSPMPATGFTITVRKSKTVELDLSVDQAFQFIFSCGVVVPVSQLHDEDAGEVRAAIEQHLASRRRDREESAVGDQSQ